MSNKYRVLKYEGDDAYSYAIFKSNDVKGLRGIIMYGMARPILTGLTRPEAQYHAKKMNQVIS